MSEDIKRVMQAVKEIDVHMAQMFAALNGRMDRFESRMDKIESQMDKIESRMDKIELRLENLAKNTNTKFQELSDKVDHVTDAIDVLRENSWANSLEIKEIRRKTGI